MKFSGLVFFGVVMFLSFGAQARCYSQAEAEAEQGIRIHSELMVIGLNCQHMGARHGQNLYPMYREFTARHGKLLAQYETLLMNFLQGGRQRQPRGGDQYAADEFRQ